MDSDLGGGGDGGIGNNRTGDDRVRIRLWDLGDCLAGGFEEVEGRPAFDPGDHSNSGPIQVSAPAG